MKSSNISDVIPKHSPVRNYIVPGLTSWMIANNGDGKGCVRMFESERHLVGEIAPHSHRYDFVCQVLSGFVRNRLWTPSESGDLMTSFCLTYHGIGRYSKVEGDRRRYDWTEHEYRAGDWYAMEYDEIHSIYFSRGARVLFFEGPAVGDSSVYLEPYDNETHTTIERMKVEPWMFQGADR